MRGIPSIAGMISIFLFVYLVSIAIAEKFERLGIRAFENPDNPANIVYFIATLLIITALIIIIAKLWKKEAIHVFVLLAIIATMFTLFQALLYGFVTSIVANALSLAIPVALIILLLLYPEWYVIDLSAIILSIGAVTIFGISISPYLVIPLLIVLALYDAISVYKTKHMIDLADTIVDLKLPVLFIIPYKIKYRFRKQVGGLKKQVKRKERDALFVGVGDVVIPGILVISAYSFTSSLEISLSVVAGIITGFICLMVFPSKDKPHAGLPFLNTGAIIGYILSSLIFHGILY
ncbi:MAG: hypothetical protein DRJ45_09180 [Thermoprotei archaeon]|nr:MAG: hypothetical protein DRJ45_09180 [Thermoprotei archaeon]